MLGSSDLLNYHFLDGWILNNDMLIDRFGRESYISACLFGKHGNIYVGTNSGHLFYGNTTMEILNPIIPDIVNVDVNVILEDDNYLWLGSQDYIFSKGISKVDINSNISESYQFDENINMTPTQIYSLAYTDYELWAGGENLILYFNQKEDYWQTLTEPRGIPSGRIWDLCVDNDHLWVGSNNGIARIEISTKYSDVVGIESYFNNIPVYDIELFQKKIWIGARNGLFIYSKDNPQLLKATNHGIKKFPEKIYLATSIEYFNHLCYFATNVGIVRFDSYKNEWDLVFPAGIYQNKSVYALSVSDKYLFLGLEKGLMRIEIRTGLIRDYSYEFLGNVNDIILKDNLLWLGTENGLVKFKWKKDL